MSQKPTITDVAERAGFSTATVSAVINGKDTVSDPTRRKILDVIDEMNYRPSESARRRLKRSTTASIALVIKEHDNPYYGEIVDGVRRTAEEHGYMVLVASSSGSYQMESKLVDLFIEKEVDGLLIIPVLDSSTDLGHIFALKRRNIPFVLLEQVRGIQASLVDVDNVRASQAAVEQLLELGHTRIVHFAGPTYSSHSAERLEGVRRAFSQSPLAFRDKDVIRVGAHQKDGYEKGLEFFREAGADRPTAVTCYNDLVALGLMKALNELSIRVPDDVSVIGFDDLALLRYAPWPLSTVRIPKREMGEKAAELLIHQLTSSTSSETEKVLLDFELVMRGTTAAPPASRDA